MKQAMKKIAQPFWQPLRARIKQLSAQDVRPVELSVDALNGRISELTNRIAHLEDRLDRQPKMFVPDPLFEQLPADAPFMQYSTCTAVDFYHPRYAQLCKLLGRTPQFHRKFWEWVFIAHHMIESGLVKPGNKGLGFGVGSEALPALFASFGAEIFATDAPPELAGIDAWGPNGQHSSSLEQLRHDEVIPYDLLKKRVRHGFCDMNRIDTSMSGYDFNWSACCFEHLGSLEAGMQFVINAVETTLKPGGIAVHTTELNLSSNDHTISTGGTVIYRRRDILELIDRLEHRGHLVEPMKVGPAAHAFDFHIDTPPYTHNPHLKLELAGFTTTSIGLVIRRGTSH